jgi:hypothetical protein
MALAGRYRISTSAMQSVARVIFASQYANEERMDWAPKSGSGVVTRCLMTFLTPYVAVARVLHSGGFRGKRTKKMKHFQMDAPSQYEFPLGSMAGGD